jgi:hypothetical protein
MYIFALFNVGLLTAGLWWCWMLVFWVDPFCLGGEKDDHRIHSDQQSIQQHPLPSPTPHWIAAAEDVR